MEPVVKGTAQDAFVFMLHDRLVALEALVAQLRQTASHENLTVLGTRTKAETGSVFVRVRSPTPVAIGRWASAVVTALGAVDSTRWDMWVCQHWTLHNEYVTEAVIQRAGDRVVDVVKVGNACLDCLGSDARAEVCGVVCHEWFIESVRTAGTATRTPHMYTWDPLGKGVVISEAAAEADETKAWTLLHGFVASKADVTDVWHPQGLGASTAAVELSTVLGNVLVTHS